jgi:hypothetical protein
MEIIKAPSTFDRRSVGSGDAHAVSEKYGTVADQRDMYRSEYHFGVLD